jgi:hypothetical protein
MNIYKKFSNWKFFFIIFGLDMDQDPELDPHSSKSLDLDSDPHMYNECGYKTLVLTLRLRPWWLRFRYRLRQFYY